MIQEVSMWRPGSESLLVVDDEALVREVLKRKLEGEGFQVDEADSAFEAMEYLRKQEYALVLADIMMPGMDGLALLRRIREQYPDTAVVMITALSNVSSAIEAMKLGAVDYIVKPFTLEEIILSVRQALERRRLILENRAYQEELERRVEEQTREIRHHLQVAQEKTRALERALEELRLTHGATLGALTKALDFRDHETEGHSQRVSRYSVAIARKMGLEGPILQVIEHGTLLHDIGKIGVPDSILKKPGRLTPEEWAIMRQHVELGYHLLKDIPFLKEAALIVYHHQERWDGSGYPQGLRGEEIVVGARIFAVADTYDAMTSHRPYRRALSDTQAREEIRRHAGTQFDPRVVEAFFAIPPEEWSRIRTEVERLYEGTEPVPGAAAWNPLLFRN